MMMEDVARNDDENASVTLSSEHQSTVKQEQNQSVKNQNSAEVKEDELSMTSSTASTTKQGDESFGPNHFTVVDDTASTHSCSCSSHHHHPHHHHHHRWQANQEFIYCTNVQECSGKDEPRKEDPKSNNAETKEKDDNSSKCSCSNATSSVSPDYRCPICLDLLHEPLQLDPCSHTFCDPCLRRLGNERHSKCPVCRSPIRHCNPNEEMKATVLEMHQDQYEARAALERSTDVFQLPLPPVRRPLIEVFSEWLLMNLSSPYLLTTLALVAVMIQLSIVITLSMLNRSRWSSSFGGMVLKGIQGLTKMRGPGSTWRRPIMVKVILVYPDGSAVADGEDDPLGSALGEQQTLVMDDDIVGGAHEILLSDFLAF